MNKLSRASVALAVIASTIVVALAQPHDIKPQIVLRFQTQAALTTTVWTKNGTQSNCRPRKILR
jgi:hypothetical protein